VRVHETGETPLSKLWPNGPRLEARTFRRRKGQLRLA
jgi:hypothetical protein